MRERLEMVSPGSGEAATRRQRSLESRVDPAPTNSTAPTDMHPSLSEFEQLAGEAFDAAVSNLDPAVLEKLNLGVAVSPEANESVDGSGAISLTLGTFSHHPVLGRQVELFYGSFIEAHGSLERWQWQSRIEQVIRHELQHFLEDLQGRRELAVEEQEERRLARLLRGVGRPATLGDALRQVASSGVGLLVLVGLAYLLARLLSS